MENQHYKSYEQAALEILRGNKPEEKQPVQQEQQKPETPQPLSEEVHPDALHVKPVKMDGKTKYKVHAVGSNYSSGIKVGEHLSDSELDDFSEMGGKIKHMKEDNELEEELTSSEMQMHRQMAMKHSALAKQSTGRARDLHRTAAEDHKFAAGNPWYAKAHTDALRSSKKLGVTMEEVEEIKEMGPGRSDPKAKEREESEKLMADFKAKGGIVQQGKPQKAPKRSGRMVAGGSLAGRERTVTKSGGRSYTAKMEEVEEDYDQLIEEKDAFEIELPENLAFLDYLKAAQTFTESNEEAIKIADYFFSNNDESLIIEAFMRSDIEDRVKMHQKAGSEVSLPKYSTKDGKPHAEYVVTDKESGKKTKYIHHGTMRRVERMN